MRHVIFQTLAAFLLAAPIRPMAALAAAALVVPAASAQETAKSGFLFVENNTGVPLRIGCTYYIDADGKKVELNACWDLPAGHNNRLRASANPNTEIFAQQFFFSVITADGESGGWSFGQINANGELRFQLDAKSLADHKNVAAINRQNGVRISNYGPPAQVQVNPQMPPANNGQGDRRTQLTNDIANTRFAITQSEQSLSDINNKILAANGALLIAQIAVDDAKTNGERFVAGAALLVAQRVVQELNADRNRVQSNLRGSRDRLNLLESDLSRLPN